MGNSKNKVSKKEARKLVTAKIAGALAEYSERIDKKRFKTQLKKAGKLFAADVAKSLSSQPVPIKVVREKKAVVSEPVSDATGS